MNFKELEAYILQKEGVTFVYSLDVVLAIG